MREGGLRFCWHWPDVASEVLLGRRAHPAGPGPMRTDGPPVAR
jgi:hypothetical protein